MSLFRDQFNKITVGPGADIFTNWVYNRALDHGPQYVDAYFAGAEDNYGTVSTIKTSTTSFYTDDYGTYWPMGISYSSVLHNDSTGYVTVSVNIGNFE